MAIRGRSGGDEDLTINLVVSGKEAVERDIKSFLAGLNTMLKSAGSLNLSDYFESDKASLDAVRQTLRLFIDDLDNAGRAGDFLKSYNAYLAQFDGKISEASAHIRAAFGDDMAGEIYDTFANIVKRAESQAQDIAQAFDATRLRDVFSGFTYVAEDLGVELDGIFNAVKSGDASHLTSQIEDLEFALGRANATIEYLQERIRELNDSDLKVKLGEFEDTAYRMRKEFESLLSANGVDPDNMRQFGQYLKEIENGTLTVREAFAKAKRELGELFTTPISNPEIEGALTRIEATLAKITQGATSTGDGPLAGVAEEAARGTAAIEGETNALDEMSHKAAGLDALVEALKVFANGMSASADGTANAFNSIEKLVAAIGQLDDIDTAKLSNIASVLSSIGSAGNIKLGSASVDNLIRLVSSIQNIDSGGGIRSLERLALVDFQRLSKLKVSSAALKHLWEDLPKVTSGVDVDKLERLANVNWGGFSALKISKPSVDNLRSIADIFRDSGMANFGRDTGGLLDNDVELSVSAEPDLSSVDATIEDIRQRVEKARYGAKVSIQEVEMLPDARKVVEEVYALAGKITDANGKALRFDPGAVSQIDALADGFVTAREQAAVLADELRKIIHFDPSSSEIGVNLVNQTLKKMAEDAGNGYSALSRVQSILHAIKADQNAGFNTGYDEGAMDDILQRAKATEDTINALKGSIASLYSSADSKIVGFNIEEAIARAQSGVRGLTEAMSTFASAQDTAAASAERIDDAYQHTAAEISESTTDVITPEQTESVAAVNAALSGMSETLGGIKKSMDEAFDLSKAMANVDALKEKLAGIREVLDMLRDITSATSTIDALAEKVSASGVATNKNDTGSADAVEGTKQVTSAIQEATQASEELAASAKRTAGVINQEFAEAVANMEAGTTSAAGKEADDETKARILEVITLYDRLTSARYRYVNAIGTTGNKEFLNVPIYEREIEQLEASIDSMLSEYQELQENEEVIRAFIQAEQDYEIALNKVTSAIINQQVAEEEKERAAADRQASKNAAQEEKKELTELINLRVQLEKVRTDVARAYRDGDADGLANARSMSAAIRAQIDEIIGEDEALRQQVETHQRVTKAIYEHDQAINAMDHNKFKQEAAEVERLQKVLAGLQVGSSGIKFGGNTEMVEQYQAALTRAEEALKQVENSTGKARAAAVSNFNEIIGSVKTLRDQLNAAFSDDKAGTSLTRRIESLKNQWISFTNANSSWYKQNKGAYDAIFNELSDGASLGAQRVTELQTELMRLSGQMKIAGAGGKTFFQTMREGWQRFGGWSLVTRSFTKVISTLRNAVTAVKEVDAAMTELRKVTDETESGYAKLYNSMAQMATKVGAKLSDTINSVADFSRLGFDASEALDLSEAALVYFNVGDELEDIGEATSSLISSMKAFGIEANDAMLIIDKFNEVGKKLLPMPVVTRCLAECYIGQSSVGLCA